MGSGIAQVSAQSGFKTILYDLNTVVVEKAANSIEQSLQSVSSKRKTGHRRKNATQQRLQFTSLLPDCIADIFIEAIAERSELKIDLFNQLAKMNNIVTAYLRPIHHLYPLTILLLR